MINRSKMKEASVIHRLDCIKTIMDEIYFSTVRITDEYNDEEINFWVNEIKSLNKLLKKARSYDTGNDMIYIKDKNDYLELYRFYRSHDYNFIKKIRLGLIEDDPEIHFINQKYYLDNSTKTYLMIDEVNDFVKIGRSKKPIYRERTLQSEKPSIVLKAVYVGDIESKLHEVYNNKRYRGEWFKLDSNEVFELIDKYNFCNYVR